jgi:hypothetical protein
MNKTCPRCNAVVDADGAGSNHRNHPRYFSTSYAFWFPASSHPRSSLCVSVHDHLDPLDHLRQYS